MKHILITLNKLTVPSLPSSIGNRVRVISRAKNYSNRILFGDEQLTSDSYRREFRKPN